MQALNSSSYNLIKKGLDVSALRQETISSNIANRNTANYKVNKVEFEEYLSKASDKLSLSKTHEKHLGLGGVAEPVVKKRENTSFNDNGNNVDVELEMTELAANEIYYSILVHQLNSRLSNLNYVINR